MEVSFKICKYGTDSISIIGLELDEEQYCNTCTPEDDNYAYNETISVNVIIPIDSEENENWNNIKQDINEHISEYDHSIVKLDKDGLYKVIRLIVPIINKGEYNGIVAEKIKEEWIFKLGSEEVDIKEIIQNDEIEKYIDYQYTFFLQHLKNCYFGKVQSYLEDYCKNKCELNNDTNLIWMGINVIQYLLDLGRIFEAQAILEKLQDCGGICTTTKKNFNYACGCSR